MPEAIYKENTYCIWTYYFRYKKTNNCCLSWYCAYQSLKFPVSFPYMYVQHMSFYYVQRTISIKKTEFKSSRKLNSREWTEVFMKKDNDIWCNMWRNLLSCIINHNSGRPHIFCCVDALRESPLKNHRTEFWFTFMHIFWK